MKISYDSEIDALYIRLIGRYTFHRQKLRFWDEQILAKVPNLRKVSKQNVMPTGKNTSSTLK